MLDIVPNHMALAGRDNAWWWDVLENGPSSVYAGHFDIDWDPPERKLAATRADAGPRRPVRPGAGGGQLPAGALEGHVHAALLRAPGPYRPRSLDHLVSRAARRLPAASTRRSGPSWRASGPPWGGCRPRGPRTGPASANATGTRRCCGPGWPPCAPSTRRWAAALDAETEAVGSQSRFPRRPLATAELPAGVLADGVRRGPVPALFRHKRAGRHTRRRRRRVRRQPPPHIALDPRGRDRRPPGRPHRRPPGPPRLPPPPGRGRLTGVGAGRKNTGPGRGAPDGLAGRRHHRLRLAQRRRWPFRQERRGRCAEGVLRLVHRP